MTTVTSQTRHDEPEQGATSRQLASIVELFKWILADNRRAAWVLAYLATVLAAIILAVALIGPGAIGIAASGVAGGGAGWGGAALARRVRRAARRPVMI